MTKKRSNFLRSHKKIIIASSLLVLALALIAGRMIYERAIVNEMRAIADQIQPSRTMIDQRDNIVSPSLVCIGDEPCPMLDRSWNITKPLSKESFKSILSSSGIMSVISGTCEPDPQSSGNVTLCKVGYTAGDYRVEISYNALTYDRSRDNLILRVRTGD
jgi:hypothetical protein